jgi:hypothetical protein
LSISLFPFREHKALWAYRDPDTMGAWLFRGDLLEVALPKVMRSSNVPVASLLHFAFPSLAHRDVGHGGYSALSYSRTMTR